LEDASGVAIAIPSSCAVFYPNSGARCRATNLSGEDYHEETGWTQIKKDDAMDSKLRWLAGVFVWTAMGCVVWAHAAVANDARPNVLVILADDQGWGDCSFNGNTNLSTPNLDAFARSGAAFDRFFVCPVCSPTRAEFLTGRYHPRGGVRGVSTGQERLDPNVKTIADTFKAAGYVTGAFGKWHNGSQWPYHPLARGFEEYYGFTSGHWGYYFDPPLEHNGQFVHGKGYIADDLTNHAMEFIEQHKDQRFFCYLPFNTPHSPFCVPDEYWNRLKDNPISMRGQLGNKEDVQVTRCALAMCENVDWNVGRVLAKLDELHLADNTIVVYFSDNGPADWRWNGGMKGKKGMTDEGGIREPFFIRYPGRIKPGTNVKQIAGAIDLLPTLASLTSVPLIGDKPLDGKDVSPMMLGTAGDWPDRMIFTHIGGNVSVRTQQYRLDNHGALYDMTTDPGQKTDIAKQQPEVAQKLRKAVADWRLEVLPKETDDTRPFTVGYREFPMTPLPARDGLPHGHVRRSARAPNSSYFVNWTSPEDSITWDIDVHTAGKYDVGIWYICPPDDAGSTIQVSFLDNKLTGDVAPAWNPPLIDNQDRVPRKAESYMYDFHELKLGRMELESGRGLLTLKALKIPGKEVMAVRMVTLTLK
jgi:arylsulfatase A-like enzyme